MLLKTPQCKNGPHTKELSNPRSVGSRLKNAGAAKQLVSVLPWISCLPSLSLFPHLGIRRINTEREKAPGTQQVFDKCPFSFLEAIFKKIYQGGILSLMSRTHFLFVY